MHKRKINTGNREYVTIKKQQNLAELINNINKIQ